MTPPDPDTAFRCRACGARLSRGAMRGHCPLCLVKVLEACESSGVPTARPLPLVHEFGDFELLEEIARGGMGVVYRARQRSLGRIVAVKMILAGEFAQPVSVERFRAEAAAAAALQHPNIVTVHEVGECDGRHYFSMEFVDGRDLATRVREQPLPAMVAARYLHIIAQAVHYAHQHGIIHRDLKPSNILIDPFDQPRITDFGLARKLRGESHLTLTGQMLGSPSYMAPEQTAGERPRPGPEGDIYSLGAILYTLLTGRPPFQADNLGALLVQVRDNDPLPPRLLDPGIPRDLETICSKCLEKDPARRYASAQELADELDRFLHQRPIRARPLGVLERALRTCRRRPALSALSLALVLAVAAGFAGVLSQWQLAERHRHAVEHAEHNTRLSLYAADTAGAALAVQRGDLGLARRLLEMHRPNPGQEDLRGFEWWFLQARCRGQQQVIMEGHTWIVTCAAFSPDGRLLATGSQDRSVRVWETSRWTSVTNVIASTGAVWSVAFTPDNAGLLTTGSDNLVRWWDTTSWQIRTQWAGQLACLAPGPGLLAISEGSPFTWEPAGRVSLREWPSGHERFHLPEVGRGVGLSPDGRVMAVVSAEGGISLWDAASGERQRLLQPDTAFWSLAFSPDGRYLVGTVYLKPDVYVWPLDSPVAAARLLGHTHTVWQAAFSRDGRILATTGSDRTVRLWDTQDWTQERLLQGHENEVWCAAFSPSGGILASGSKDGSVRVWSTEAPAVPAPLFNHAFFRPLFSPDSRQLLTSTLSNDVPCVTLLDVAAYQPLQTSEGDRPLGFAPDGGAVARVDVSPARLDYWTPPAREPVRTVPLHIPSSELPFAFTGFSSDWRHFFGIRSNGHASVWNLDKPESHRSLATLPSPIRSAALSPDGRWLSVSVERMDAAGLWGSSLFEVDTGRESRLHAHRDHVTSQAFSPDGQLLATASVDGSIKLWDVRTGRELASLTGHLQEATDVAFSPDGRTLASLEQSGGFRLWHVATRRELLSWPLPSAGLFLQFSPNGHHLAVNVTDTRGSRVELFNAP